MRINHTLVLTEIEIVNIRVGLSGVLAILTSPSEEMTNEVVIPMIESMCLHQRNELMTLLERLNEIKIDPIRCDIPHS